MRVPSADCNTATLMESNLDIDVNPDDRSFSEKVTVVGTIE